MVKCFGSMAEAFERGWTVVKAKATKEYYCVTCRNNLGASPVCEEGPLGPCEIIEEPR